MLIICACGCGEQLEEFSKWGYKRKYFPGHSHVGYWKGKHLPPELRLKMSLIRKGKKLSPATVEKMKGQRHSIISEFKKGFIPWNKGSKGIMPTPWNKGLKGFMAGAKNNFWKGGRMATYPELERIRKSVEYIAWRKTVFERDNYTCQLCNEHGGRLHADHIKRFADYPELRLNISNGRTLCYDCHKKTLTYGRHTVIKTNNCDYAKKLKSL